VIRPVTFPFHFIRNGNVEHFFSSFQRNIESELSQAYIKINEPLVSNF